MPAASIWAAIVSRMAVWSRAFSTAMAIDAAAPRNSSSNRLIQIDVHSAV
jgi:hypothetical protein